MAGYFFFNRIEKLENEAQKKEYAISYLVENIENIFCLVSCAFTEQVDTE